MSWLLYRWTALPERVDRDEWLDLGNGSLEDVGRSLADLARINRWLGGDAALRRLVFPAMLRLPRSGPIALLDVGTGSAAVPVAIARWARKHHVDVRITALDSNPRHLAFAQNQVGGFPEIRLISGDLRSLPFAPHQFDIVLSTLLLHHLPPRSLQAVLPSLARLCRGALILNDLVRAWPPLAFFRLTAPLFARSHLTRHDGRVSVARAYTPVEMRSILDQAGLPDAKIHTHGLYYRMTVVWEREPA